MIKLNIKDTQGTVKITIENNFDSINSCEITVRTRLYNQDQQLILPFESMAQLPESIIDGGVSDSLDVDLLQKLHWNLCIQIKLIDKVREENEC